MGRTVLMISICFRPNVGGLETHLDDLCEYLRKNGYRVYVITYQPITTKAVGKMVERNNDLTVYRIPWFGHNLFFKLEPYPLLEFIYLTPMLLFSSLLFMLKHGEETDVIHAHGLNAAFVARLLAEIFKKRVVVSIHAIYGLDKNPILAKLMKFTLSKFNSILTLSKRSRTELINIGLDEGKVKVFTHWINQEVFKPMDKDGCKEKFGWRDKFVILFVGRLIEVKGVRLLLKIAKRLSSKYKDIHFVFIGEGPLVGEVKIATRKLMNVVYVGRIETKRLVAYYNVADCVIVPSYKHEEGFGRVILESLSCGTPVIASNIGGIPEALDHSVGVLVEPKIEAIEEKIVEFYKDRSKLVKLTENCRRYAEERFSEKNAKIIEESYAVK